MYHYYAMNTIETSSPDHQLARIALEFMIRHQPKIS